MFWNISKTQSHSRRTHPAISQGVVSTNTPVKLKGSNKMGCDIWIFDIGNIWSIQLLQAYKSILGLLMHAQIILSFCPLCQIVSGNHLIAVRVKALGNQQATLHGSLCWIYIYIYYLARAPTSAEFQIINGISNTCLRIFPRGFWIPSNAKHYS